MDFIDIKASNSFSDFSNKVSKVSKVSKVNKVNNINKDKRLVFEEGDVKVYRFNDYYKYHYVVISSNCNVGIK
jgi:hypothetical protein